MPGCASAAASALVAASTAAAGPAAAPADAESSSPEHGSTRKHLIAPLWMQALLALPMSDLVQHFRYTRPVLESALLPVVRGSVTPAFLRGSSAGSSSSSSSDGGCTGSLTDSSSSSSTAAVTGAGSGAAGAARAPAAAASGGVSLAAPAEQKVLLQLMARAGREPAVLWAAGIYSVWWPSCLHRLDVLAWALHPHQAHLWGQPAERVRVEGMLGAYILDGRLQHQADDPLLGRAQEQQLRQHQQRLAAGVTAGSCGALPHFVAGAADTASAMLAMGRPVFSSRVVRSLRPSGGAPHVESVKGFQAAFLAASDAQLASLMHVHAERGWLGFAVQKAVQKALAVGDPDLVCLVALANERAQRIIDG